MFLVEIFILRWIKRMLLQVTVAGLHHHYNYRKSNIVIRGVCGFILIL